MKQLFTGIFLAFACIGLSQDFSILKEQLAEEDYTSANKTVKKLLQKHPDNADVLYWSGAVLCRTYLSKDLNPNKEYKPLVDAGISFEKANFLNPNCLQNTDGGHQLKAFSGVVFNLGVTAFKKKEVEMAFTFFKMSKSTSEWLGKDDVESSYYAGHCANEMEDFQTAENFLEDVLKKDPTHLNAIKALVKAKNGLGNYASSVALMKKALIDFPNEKYLWQELMSASLKMGDSGEALAAAQTLSHIDSNNPNTMAFLASLYDSQGDQEKALETYTACLSINPEHIKATYNLGVLLYNQAITVLNMAPTAGEKEKAQAKLSVAKEHLEKAQQLDPTLKDVQKILNNIENLE